MREGSGGEEVVRHEVGLPEKAERWLEEIERMGEDERDGLDDERTRRENEGLGAQALGPFESRRMEISNGELRLCFFFLERPEGRLECFSCPRHRFFLHFPIAAGAFCIPVNPHYLPNFPRPSPCSLC